MPYCVLHPNEVAAFPLVMLHGRTPEGHFTRSSSGTSDAALIGALLDDPAYEDEDDEYMMRQRMHLATVSAAEAALAGLPLIISDVPGLSVLNIRSDSTLLASLNEAHLIEIREAARD